eukprot:Sdes_comp22892_c0_seq1m21268
MMIFKFSLYLCTILSALFSLSLASQKHVNKNEETLHTVSPSDIASLVALLLFLYIGSSSRFIRRVIFLAGFSLFAYRFYVVSPTLISHSFCCAKGTPPHILYIATIAAGLLGGILSVLLLKLLILVSGALFGIVSFALLI